MKGKSEVGWGLLIILVQLIGIAQYIKNGCIDLATGLFRSPYLWTFWLTIVIAIAFNIANS